MRTSYISGNVEEEQYSNCVRISFSCFKKFVIYKILNIFKLFWFTVNSSVLSNKGIQFFFHDICHLFACIADCYSSRNLKPTLFQIFRVFLTTGNFALYMSIMFEEKVCQFRHKLNNCGSSPCLVIKTDPTRASQNDWKIW